MEYSFQEFIKQFNILSTSPDPALRAQAARYVYEFQVHFAAIEDADFILILECKAGVDHL